MSNHRTAATMTALMLAKALVAGLLVLPLALPGASATHDLPGYHLNATTPSSITINPIQTIPAQSTPAVGGGETCDPVGLVCVQTPGIGAIPLTPAIQVPPQTVISNLNVISVDLDVTPVETTHEGTAGVRAAGPFGIVVPTPFGLVTITLCPNTCMVPQATGAVGVDGDVSFTTSVNGSPLPPIVVPVHVLVPIDVTP